ncbi:MAG: ribonuclease H-like domain-containing protein [Kiritimatiellae bacterium]|nr:ribonuclease H-like domain-containing protein [Kiritimatiellia bacterium]
MLQNTFLHICGIGLVRERRLWNAGIRTWADCLAAEADLPGLVSGAARVREQVEQSLQAYREAAWTFFEKRLPSDHKWRAFGDFRDRTLYLDIETTGLTCDDSITIIGMYNGRETKTFVLDRNLREAIEEIDRYPIMVTYNGACFDIPMIQRQFATACRNHIHIDLRYPLRRLGYSGGLKGVERAMGIQRSEATRGLDGRDAVRLWQTYLSGSQEALDLLVAYNAEDVRNLKPLMEFVYQTCYSDLDLTTRKACG